METYVLDLNDRRIVVSHDLLFSGAIRGSSYSCPQVSIIKLSCLATIGGQAYPFVFGSDPNASYPLPQFCERLVRVRPTGLL